MKTLKRIEIYNFQSHEHTDLFFSENMNVIIGPSDSGKTAIIRAIKWALFNEPTGSSFVQFGKNETKVILYFDDNLIIERGRIKNKNYYKVTHNKISETYEGFGHKVPEEIKILLNMDKINLNDKYIIINIAEQLE